MVALRLIGGLIAIAMSFGSGNLDGGHSPGQGHAHINTVPANWMLGGRSRAKIALGSDWLRITSAYFYRKNINTA